MIRAIWFFIKVGLLIAASVWVANRPGVVEIEWLDYKIETTVGIALLALIITIIICAQLYRAWRSFLSVPTWWKKYSKTKDRENGYEALTKGLVAIAAGDKKQAQKFSKKATKLIPENALTKLLKAQTALLHEDFDDAEVAFLKLIEDDKASFLGVRGLLNQKLNTGDLDAALRIVRHADQVQPKTQWILKILFDLEVHTRDWTRAEETLHKAFKAKLFSKTEFRNHKAVILLARADLALANGSFDVAFELTREAWRLDEYFIPAICAYATSLQKQDNSRKAQKILEKAWKRQNHRDLARIWCQLFDDTHGDEAKAEERLAWIEKLKKWQPDSKEGRFRYAIAAMDIGLYEKARPVLEELVEDSPTEMVFLALSDLELKQFKNDKAASLWLKKAQNAEQEAAWLCDICHHDHSHWAPVCKNCGSFNSLVWGVNDFNLHTNLNMVKHTHILPAYI